jgi:hypothetical protein
VSGTGVGPYKIGEEQATLLEAKLVGPIQNGVTGCDTGLGVAKWGSPTLTFIKGTLQHVKISSTAVRTTAGIKVGDSYADARSAYRKGSALSASGKAAWYVPAGTYALLFRIVGGKIATVEAGPSSTLQFTFTSTPNC